MREYPRNETCYNKRKNILYYEESLHPPHIWRTSAHRWLILRHVLDPPSAIFAHDSARGSHHMMATVARSYMSSIYFKSHTHTNISFFEFICSTITKFSTRIKFTKFECRFAIK